MLTGQSVPCFPQLSQRLLSYSLPAESFFFFNDTATTEIYTLSLHDALPISSNGKKFDSSVGKEPFDFELGAGRSEEHTSELQSLRHLVCRLLLEKKKKTAKSIGSSRLISYCFKDVYLRLQRRTR